MELLKELKAVNYFCENTMESTLQKIRIKVQKEEGENFP